MQQVIDDGDGMLENRVVVNDNAIQRLESTQEQLLQSEKMASIGHLAAGVAHEINNPIGYVSSNLETLSDYADDLLLIIDAYRNGKEIPASIDIDYLSNDLKALIKESQEGINKVKDIVKSLKDFTHVDDEVWSWADLHEGIESVLNIVNNELKYKAEIIRDYGDLPAVECMPSQLNQVVMNMLVNAAQAIDGSGATITIRTRVLEGASEVKVEIIDTGKGIKPEDLSVIFDPFFTTKAVGQGTGLGLSLSYSIIEKHHGYIEVDSTLGEGTTFSIILPIKQEES